MFKKSISAMLLAVLVLLCSTPFVSAKKPDTPPGKPVEEIGTYSIDIDGAIDLIATNHEAQPDGEVFVVDTYIGDWDYIGGVDGGVPRESYRWSYQDIAYDNPMTTYGMFSFIDVFRNAAGYDFRPVMGYPNQVTEGDAHMLYVGHGVNVDQQMDWWFLAMNWTREVDGNIVEVDFIARTKIDPVAEGDYVLNADGTVDTRTVTFSNDNTEFRLMYWWYAWESVQIGKSQNTKEEYVYHNVILWNLDGGPQPNDPLSITVTIDRLS